MHKARYSIHDKKNNIKKCQYCSKKFKIETTNPLESKLTYCNDCLKLLALRNRYVSNICNIL